MKDLALGVEHRLDGPGETLVQPLREVGQGAGLHAKHPAADGNGVEAAHFTDAFSARGWRNGPGEGAPCPCGQTRARATMPVAWSSARPSVR